MESLIVPGLVFLSADHTPLGTPPLPSFAGTAKRRGGVFERPAKDFHAWKRASAGPCPPDLRYANGAWGRTLRRADGV